MKELTKEQALLIRCTELDHRLRDLVNMAERYMAWAGLNLKEPLDDPERYRWAKSTLRESIKMAEELTQNECPCSRCTPEPRPGWMVREQ